jgi:hypothetical protein
MNRTIADILIDTTRLNTREHSELRSSLACWWQDVFNAFISVIKLAIHNCYKTWAVFVLKD